MLVVCAVGLHEVLNYYDADAEFELLTVFVATFASSILTFFIGALLFDYQLERTEARRSQQLRTLLVAELDGISEGLDRANTMKVSLPDGSTVEVEISHVQPTVIEEAVRNGFFDPPREALRLARNMHAYNARVSYLLSILSSGNTRDEPGPGQLVPHTIQDRTHLASDRRGRPTALHALRPRTWGRAAGSL